MHFYFTVALCLLKVKQSSLASNLINVLAVRIIPFM